MKNLLCLYEGTGFFGAGHFRDSDFLREHEIEPTAVGLETFTEDAVTDVADNHPETDYDAVMVHQNDHAEQLVETGVYDSNPLFVAGHVIPVGPSKKQQWRDIVRSGREVYLFTGSVRAGRLFNIPDADNLQIVIAPIMGRATGSRGKLLRNSISNPKQEYDIGFFSSLNLKKRPHTVLETANAVAQQLDDELRVWIAGHETNSTYNQLVESLIIDNHYEHLNAEYKGYLSTEELFTTVQKTQVMYMPLLKPSETTCYSAWEIESYDVPLVGSDWAGIGEAIKQSRNPHSSTVPVTKITTVGDLFSESVRKAYPEVIGRVTEQTSFTPFMIKERAAQRSLRKAVKAETEYKREFRIHEQVRTETTVAAFADILNNRISTHTTFQDDLIESYLMDVLKTENGYSLLRDSSCTNPFLYQSSPYDPPSDEIPSQFPPTG